MCCSALPRAPQIDYWLDYASGSVVAGANFDAVCNGINDYLALRTFVVGHSLSVADVALWGQLQAGTMWKKVQGQGNVPHLSRWFDFVSQLPECKAAVDEFDLNAKKRAAIAADASEKKPGGGKKTAGGCAWPVHVHAWLWVLLAATLTIRVV